MGKSFGILLIVGAIWVGLEIYTEGYDGAFGGALVSSGLVSAPAPEQAGGVTDRNASKLQSAYDAQRERVERQTGN